MFQLLYLVLLPFALSYPNRREEGVPPLQENGQNPGIMVNSFSNPVASDPPENWNGRWFPDSSPLAAEGMTHPMPSMTDVDPQCDDGKSHLEVDWSGSAFNYSCFNWHKFYLPDPSLPDLLINDKIPPAYKARHACMDEPIYYDQDVPSFGTHRPVWPKYGEYKFVPRQRWLHNLEHGGIVMLYHPCAHPLLVQKLRTLVTSCLYRHIITPLNLLSPQRPLALVSWGWTLLLSNVDTDIVTNFIKEHALQGPEKVSTDGIYDHLLIRHAKVVSDIDDSLLCPSHHH